MVWGLYGKVKGFVMKFGIVIFSLEVKELFEKLGEVLGFVFSKTSIICRRCLDVRFLGSSCYLVRVGWWVDWCGYCFCCFFGRVWNVGFLCLCGKVCVLVRRKVGGSMFVFVCVGVYEDKNKKEVKFIYSNCFLMYIILNDL